MPRLDRQALTAWLQKGHVTLLQFLSWWTEELCALIPPSLVSFLAGSGDTLFLRVEGETLSIEIDEKKHSAILDLNRRLMWPDAVQGRLDQANTVLVIPREKVLRRIIKLPLAAAANVRNAAYFLIDRQTPFSPEQVAFCCRVLRRDIARKQLDVELAVTPKAVLDIALQRSDAAGFQISKVAVEGDDNIQPFDFMPAKRRQHRSSWNREPWKPILLMSAILVLVGFPLTAGLIHDRTKSLDHRVGTMREEGQRVEAQLSELTASRDAARFIPQKQVDLRWIELLDLLTRTLPDDTWLFNLELSGAVLKLSGYSSDVPGLIKRLQAVPEFQVPDLSEAVLRTAGNDRSRFELSVTLKSQGAPS